MTTVTPAAVEALIVRAENMAKRFVIGIDPRPLLSEAATMLRALKPGVGEIRREVNRMRECANDWRRPAVAQVEGPNDLKIYGGTIADDIDRWADMLSAALILQSNSASGGEALAALEEAIDFADGLHASYDYLGTGSNSKQANKEYAEDAKKIARLRKALDALQSTRKGEAK